MEPFLWLMHIRDYLKLIPGNVCSNALFPSGIISDVLNNMCISGFNRICSVQSTGDSNIFLFIEQSWKYCLHISGIK